MDNDRRFYWTKVWGAPEAPGHEALAFNSDKTRDAVLGYIRPGDVVVYLTSDATEADPMRRGRVAGAAEIATPPEPVSVEEIREGLRNKPEDYREDGRFRWPYGITLSRTWRVTDQESNDTLIPDHASKGIQGAATIHPMSPEEVQRFMNLRVREQVEDATEDDWPSLQSFASSLRRPWKQRAGRREGGDVVPGTTFYIAVIADRHGMTFKAGSGKVDERLAALNLYRRASQGEQHWAIHHRTHFESVEAARAAEDHLLARTRELGFCSPDHGEFIVRITMKQLGKLITEAVEAGTIRESDGVHTDAASGVGGVADAGGAVLIAGS